MHFPLRPAVKFMCRRIFSAKDMRKPTPMIIETAMPAGEMPLMSRPSRLATTSERSLTTVRKSLSSWSPMMSVLPEKAVISRATPDSADENRNENATRLRLDTL